MPEKYRFGAFILIAALTANQTLCFTTIPDKQCNSGACRLDSASSENLNNENERQLLPAWLESPVDSERRPARRASLRPDKVYFNDWSVEQYQHPQPIFPDTVDTLTDAAWEAIAGTLYRKQRLDPNFASNAMSSSVYGYRPVRRDRDIGRIGLEIDGARYLYRGETSGTAMRRVALELGAKLSAAPWKGFECDADGGAATSRPVAIYFNTIKQSLIASQELLVLKRKTQEETGSSRRYENVTILCLQQDDGIPEHMHGTKRAHGALVKGSIQPARGIIVVVQPTDYNSEFRPPGPSIGTVENLQRLVARAAVDELPVVVISPRFLANEHHVSGGWDQSGYQQSSAYGGAEPPKGPTPWLMRDFTPPVFSWIGSCLSLSGHNNHHVKHIDGDGRSYHYSRIVCIQSVMQESHPFHLFAVKEYDKEDDRVLHTDHNSTYQYLASTKTSSERPPREVIQHIYNEWS
jgi:hypothetical protein